MKKLICFFTIFVFWGITDSIAQGLHFGVKAGVLGNKANISGMRDQFKEESLTGFQVGPMLQYQTGFHGIVLDFCNMFWQDIVTSKRKIKIVLFIFSFFNCVKLT